MEKGEKKTTITECVGYLDIDYGGGPWIDAGDKLIDTADITGMEFSDEEMCVGPKNPKLYKIKITCEIERI